MDILLIKASVFELPSNYRAAAMVYDGATDLSIAAGPGPDRDLSRAYGPELGHILNLERNNLASGSLPPGRVIRIHPGRLRCDFLVWLASHPPEREGKRPPAPAPGFIDEAVAAVLHLACEHLAVRVAFPAVGRGTGEAAVVDRLERIVRAAHAFEERRYAEGRAPVIEEVVVCAETVPDFNAVYARTRGIVKVAVGTPLPKPSEPPKPRASGGRTAGSAPRTRRSARPVITEDEVQAARRASEPYNMRKTYQPGALFVHPKFGVGRVETLTQEGAIMVLFQDGEQRKMVHGRA
jgi:O-acetyl-ADP-ribose deacetylase (regulator of RNase III)